MVLMNIFWLSPVLSLVSIFDRWVLDNRLVYWFNKLLSGRFYAQVLSQSGLDIFLYSKFNKGGGAYRSWIYWTLFVQSNVVFAILIHGLRKKGPHHLGQQQS